MKKVLLTVSALGLGLALAATTASAMTFTAGGKANITGIYLNHGSSAPGSTTHSQATILTDSNGNPVGVDLNGDGVDDAGPLATAILNGSIPTIPTGAVVNGGNGGFRAGVANTDEDDNVDGWHNSFYLYPKLDINDVTSVQGELRFIDRQVYGFSDRDTMKVFRLWANYKSPIGTISFGRMPAGTWGGNPFLDSTKSADRIKWSTDMGATTIYAVYQKNLEQDAYTGATDKGDAASYLAGVKFGSDMGTTDIAVWYTRFDEDAGDYNNTELWYSGAYNFGGIGLVGEAHYAMGDDSAGNDISSFAAFVTANTKIDTMTAGALLIYGQGDDEADGDNNGYVTRNGLGNDFNPFLIATGDYFGLLNGDKNAYLSALSPVALTHTGNGDNPGMIALAAYLVAPINDQLTVNAAAGHVWADKHDFGMDLDSKIGWEVDLGMSYKLADNLTYSASLGYLKPGQMLEDLLGDTNNIFALVHSLTMTW